MRITLFHVKQEFQVSFKKLIDFFSHHKNLPAKHDLDAGALLDPKGNEILMNIPLKQKLPYRNKGGCGQSLQLLPRHQIPDFIIQMWEHSGAKFDF